MLKPPDDFDKQWRQMIAKLRAERKKALADGDTVRADTLKAHIFALSYTTPTRKR